MTLIGGANGSGKTTVLEGIVGLFRLLEAKFAPWEGVRGQDSFGQLDLVVDDKPLSLEFGRKPADHVLPEGVEEFHRDPNKRLVEQTYGGLTYDLMGLIKGAVDTKSDLGLPPKEPSGLPSILYFPHYRVIRRIVGDQLNREPNYYQWVHEVTAPSKFAGSLDSTLTWLDYSDPQAFAWIKDLADSLDLDGKTFSVDRKGLRVMVTTRSGAQHPLSLLSSGEQNLLIFAIELGRRLLPGSVVLIDEIENSLHPAFQAKLGRILLEMQNKVPFQLIATTHAPAFLDVFGADRTVLLTEF